MMPYIVTTKRPGARRRGALAKALGFESRRAVATLDEARQDARNGVEDRAQEPGWLPEWVAARDVARELSESGGTVGPLPDGTVIEVAPVSWNWIVGCAEDLGINTERVYADEGGDMGILAAYNAAQEA